VTREEIFDAWAPAGTEWSSWVKPVLFSQMTGMDPAQLVPLDPEPDLTWAKDAHGETAMVVDLTGAIGVSIGISLAGLGWRPVPLYNACPEPSGGPPMVDVRPIMDTIAGATPVLARLSLQPDARPVFLLDADRNHARVPRSPGVFDNRSVSLPTDFPSAHLLLARGIRRVILVVVNPGPPQTDLSHTLRRWQEAGIGIHVKVLNDPRAPEPILIKRPSAFRLFWYNLAATIGLMRSPFGGFGGKLPMPSSSAAG
jgi:hypothetical protein